MPTYIFTHAGIWPVGACSVVTAPDVDAAAAILKFMLHDHGIRDADLCIKLVWQSGQPDKIILDGDY